MSISSSPPSPFPLRPRTAPQPAKPRSGAPAQLFSDTLGHADKTLNGSQLVEWDDDRTDVDHKPTRVP